MHMYIYQQHHFTFPYDYYRVQMPMMNMNNLYQNKIRNEKSFKVRERSRDKAKGNDDSKTHITRSNSSFSKSSSDSR